MKTRLDRRAQRYQVRLEILELNGQPPKDASVVDISSLGARLEAAVSLAPRNPVEFSVALPDTQELLRLSGKVVWLRPFLDRPGRFLMGVQFFSPQWDIDRLAREGRLGPRLP